MYTNFTDGGVSLSEWNLIAVWVGIAVGVLAGAMIGVRFHDTEWLGGYASWPRRMLRLGHIACFGLAIVNLAFIVTVERLPAETGVLVPSVLLIIGAVTMPLICWLSAWNKPVRHLFPVPVLAVLLGSLWTAWLAVAT